MLDNGIAQPSSSSWASPCLLVPKSDNTPRFCSDFRKVNHVTKPDSFPLPRMEDCIDQVGSAKYVSKFDLLKGYWQVPLSEKAREIAAFITPTGLYSYTVMPFGLRNAPATFQRLMNMVVGDLEGCSVYLDDVVIYSESWDDHLGRITKLFDRLAHANLTVNLAKCEFAKATVTYLGRVVGQGMVAPVRAKVQAIDDYAPPPTKKALMRFLGLVGYYRCFCRNFSTVVAPLTNLLKAKMKYVWSAECQSAFENVKALICNAPVLAAPQWDRAFKLEVDASAVGAGAVLLQADDLGVDKPLCFFSRKFNRHQLNYSVIEKETLALILALQHFNVYVSSSPVVVFKDHNPLTFLSSLQSPNQRLVRWALFLQSYSLDIRHVKGRDNVVADALSLAPC
ncbi:retrovirus-related Pol polyprotein from transposon 297 [Acanthopagrus schlegelii]